jgi:hypothetical protein
MPDPPYIHARRRLERGQVSVTHGQEIDTFPGCDQCASQSEYDAGPATAERRILIRQAEDR